MAEMKYAELKKSLDSKNFGKLYFLSGETDLINYFEKRILSETLGKNFTDFDFTLIKGEEFSNENLQTAVNTFPMLTGKKCILVKDLPFEGLDSKEIEILLETLSDIPDFSIVVISQTSKSLAAKHASKLTKLKNFIKKNGIYSDLSQKDFPMEKQIIAWVKRDFGKEIEPIYAKKIMKLCEGYQIHEIKNEVKKICEFEKSKEITQTSLEIIWKTKTKTNIFELPKALISNDAKRTFEVLSDLFSQNEEPYVILGVISSEYNNIYRAKLFLENGKDPLELAKIFDYKNKEFRIKNAQKIAKRLKFSDIKEIIFKLANADMKLKSTSIDPKTIISELLVFILLKMRNMQKTT